MGRLLINCDLGEDESSQRTAALMSSVDAANICCGVHAGGPAVTGRTLSLARARKVLVGAHPGLSAAGGRGAVLPNPRQFTSLLQSQVGDFMQQAAERQLSIHYIKLHGSLYHAVEYCDDLLECYLKFLLSLSVPIAIFALAGGRCARSAHSCGIPVYAEVFADRGYQLDGQLVSRQLPGAVLSPATALERFKHWRASGRMATLCGREIQLAADTLCVHGDSVGAIELLRGLKAAL
jgi:5-oxoprolinase (ATP-hydrolysing) subunit A